MREENRIIGVSIVTFHSSERLVEVTMQGLARWRPADVRVHIHDNASSPQESAMIRACADRTGIGTKTTVTWTHENLGFAAGQNHGMSTLFSEGCEVVVVHNPDLVLSPNAVSLLLEEVDRFGAVPVLAGPMLELADPVTMAGTGLVDTLGIRWTRDGRHLDVRQGSHLPSGPSGTNRVAGISGACLMVTRRSYDLIVSASGEFFDETFIAYREDAELAYRAGLLGVGSYVCTGARGLHARRLRGTVRGTDSFIDGLGVRNRFLIAFKYGRRRPGNLLEALVRDLVVVIAVVLRERSSLDGLKDAWRLRHLMRAKGARVLRASLERQ